MKKAILLAFAFTLASLHTHFLEIKTAGGSTITQIIEAFNTHLSPKERLNIKAIQKMSSTAFSQHLNTLLRKCPPSLKKQAQRTISLIIKALPKPESIPEDGYCSDEESGAACSEQSTPKLRRATTTHCLLDLSEIIDLRCASLFDPSQVLTYKDLIDWIKLYTDESFDTDYCPSLEGLRNELVRALSKITAYDKSATLLDLKPLIAVISGTHEYVDLCGEAPLQYIVWYIFEELKTSPRSPGGVTEL